MKSCTKIVLLILLVSLFLGGCTIRHQARLYDLETADVINEGDVDENNHFTFLGNCGRRFLCLGKQD